MARLKIDYGIDLGTTNSAICRMEKGEPTIIKTDVRKDTMPSCISVNRRGSITAGDGAYNTMKQDKRRATKSWKAEASNTYIEFKRTMATDTRYRCANLNKDFSSEELSAEVLKTLKSFVTDETINSIVITVPAKFTVPQKTATLEAATLAGFSHCELLQEPIAAAMAYGLNSEEKNGIWMVFDFGGGTFDAALLKVEDGIMQVFDTEGDNYLGGKNLDYAIVDNLIIPYLQDNFQIDGYLSDDTKKTILRNAMKTYAEEAKNQLSFKDKEDILSNLGDLGEDENGEELELDMTLTQVQVFEVMRPIFQRAVDICKDLLKRNNLQGNQINKLILVGGPTHSPLIRQMLQEQITPNVDTSIDPMTAVATGAALYASTLDNVIAKDEIEQGTLQLDVTYPTTTVETTEYITVKLPVDSNLQTVWVSVTRADNSWSSGKVEINKNGNIIDVDLLPSKPNPFYITVYNEQGDTIPCFPAEITIIQGTAVSSAPLPYNIGIAIWNKTKQRGVFRMAKGLEKNKPLPAVGVINDLSTSADLRPGVEEDILDVPIYQVDDFTEAEGRSVAFYEHIGNVIITGEDVDTLIPKNSLVDITLKVDSSEQMTLIVNFPTTDATIEKQLDTSKKASVEDVQREIKVLTREAQQGIDALAEESIPTGNLQQELDDVKEDFQTNTEVKAVLENLKKVLRKIEQTEDATAWQRLEKQLRDEFAKLEEAQEDLGDNKTARIVEQLRQRTDEVIHAKNVKIGREVLENIKGLYAHLTMLYLCIGCIEHYNDNFSRYSWTNAQRARQLINQGLQVINNQPTVDTLRPIAIAVLDLLPEDERADSSNPGGLLK